MWCVAVAAVLLACFQASSAEVVSRTLVLMDGYVSPDGCDRRAILVNGGFIGPTIRVKQGDELRVTVVNMLQGRGVSLHWHGLSPINPWMDGAFGEAQCLIDKGTFTYRFMVYAHPGTYWWHGHAVAERVDGLYGALIVEPPHTALPANATESEKMIAETDGEIVMLLQDWSHYNSIDQTVGLDAVPPRALPLASRVILVNGKVNPGPGFIASDPTCVNETLLNPAAAPPTFPVFSVEKGKSYYVRIINAGSFAFMALQFQGHKFTVVSADGEYIQPYEATELTINLAQRYGVILHADQDVGHYWMPVNSLPSGPPSGAAILHYVGAGAPQAWGASAPPPPTVPLDSSYNPANVRGAQPLPADMAALEPDAEILMDGYFDQTFRWVLNGTVFEFPPSGTPLLNYAYAGKLNELEGTASAPVATLAVGTVVDIVFQNYPLPFGVVEPHAWHLHGHSFYILGYGAGKFDRAKHAHLLNLKDPVLRDTATLYANTTFDGSGLPIDPANPAPYFQQAAGWTVVRFKAANPGAWLMHCHIEPHTYLRMIGYLVVQPDAIPAPPDDMPECGTVEQYQKEAGGPGPHACGDGHAPVGKWGRCGGKGYNGSTCCVSGTSCMRVSDYYSHCV